MLEVMNITPFIFAWITRIGFQFDPNREVYRLGMFATQRYAEIGTASLSYATGFNFDSISILVSFLKLFKYFRLINSKFALLWNVLSRAGKDMMFFAAMTVLFLFGFILFAQEMFGTQLSLFSDSIQSMTTLLKMIFGVVDIYWDMIRTANPGFERYLAMVFFIGYVVWMFFIFINIFLAILNDAYGGVKGEMDEAEEEARLAAEEAKANGVGQENGVRERAEAMRKAARGRLGRIQTRIARMAKRRKATPMTALDAVADVTAAGINIADLEEEAARLRNRRKKRSGAPPPVM